ncbi:Contactin-5 [Bagarius yarrelli]|uniref:Contactin-5 n=1 Tax=Bagarius yarrelli TaxID=175774 RepID=A0A556UZR4_BAGYA|nr:Contactin-5 [Bagarius yarrelli]
MSRLFWGIESPTQQRSSSAGKLSLIRPLFQGFELEVQQAKDVGRSVPGRPVSYAAVLRMKSDSSSSSVLNPRVRQRQDGGLFDQDWTPFSRQRLSALNFQEEDQSEGVNQRCGSETLAVCETGVIKSSQQADVSRMVGVTSRGNAGLFIMRECLRVRECARVGRGHGLQEIEEGSSEHFRLPESRLCSLVWLMDAFLKKREIFISTGAERSSSMTAIITKKSFLLYSNHSRAPQGRTAPEWHKPLLKPDLLVWMINGTVVDTEANSRYRLIDGNLIIMNASLAADFGKYQCRAENSVGAVLSREAVLQFASRVMDRESRDTRLRENTLIVFSSVSSGDAALRSHRNIYTEQQLT